MTNNSNRQIDSLSSLDKSSLEHLWQEVFGSSPKKGLRRELMIPVLAYRLQEKEHGGLKPSTRTQLSRLASEFGSSSQGKAKARPMLKPGTRLIREWQGKTHQVTVTNEGYEYASETFSSLSQIARQITGTRWSGPLFFGLRGSEARSSAR